MENSRRDLWKRHRSILKNNQTTHSLYFSTLKTDTNSLIQKFSFLLRGIGDKRWIITPPKLTLQVAIAWTRELPRSRTFLPRNPTHSASIPQTQLQEFMGFKEACDDRRWGRVEDGGGQWEGYPADRLNPRTTCSSIPQGGFKSRRTCSSEPVSRHGLVKSVLSAAAVAGRRCPALLALPRHWRPP